MYYRAGAPSATNKKKYNNEKRDDVQKMQKNRDQTHRKSIFTKRKNVFFKNIISKKTRK
jgi:hypothetical protein